MKRSTMREAVFQQLYLGEFYPEGEKQTEFALYLNNDGLLQELEIESAEKPLSAEDKEQISARLGQVLIHIDELDAAIDEASENWRTDRMSRIDLSLLRLALFEMRFDDDIPLKVAINEAVELAKKYGGENSSSFINGVLGRLARNEE